MDSDSPAVAAPVPEAVVNAIEQQSPPGHEDDGSANCPELASLFPKGKQFFSHEELKSYALNSLRRYKICDLVTDYGGADSNKDHSTKGKFPYARCELTCGMCSKKDREISSKTPGCCGFMVKAKLVRNFIKIEETHLIIVDAKFPLNSRHYSPGEPDDNTLKRDNGDLGPLDFESDFPLLSRWSSVEEFKTHAINKLHRYGITRLSSSNSSRNKQEETKEQFPMERVVFNCRMCSTADRLISPDTPGCCGLKLYLRLVRRPDRKEGSNGGDFQPYLCLGEAVLPKHSKHIMKKEEIEQLALELERERDEEQLEIDEEEIASQSIMKRIFPPDAKFFSSESFIEYAVSNLKDYGIHNLIIDTSSSNADPATSTQYPRRIATYFCGTCSRKERSIPTETPMCCGLHLKVVLVNKSAPHDRWFIPYLSVKECKLPPTSKHFLMTPDEHAEAYENREIRKETELSQAQLSLLKALGKSGTSPAEAREVLRKEYPGRKISNDLLYRILKNGRKEAQESRGECESNTFRHIVNSHCEFGIDESVHDDNNSSSHAFDEVSDNDPMKKFFQTIWQNQPAIYRSAHQTPVINESGDSDSNPSPLNETINMGWQGVTDLLHHCRQRSSYDSATNSGSGTSPPLFFQNGKPITDPDTLYSCNPHAAYLDGCSIIVNHADFHHSCIANLCKNLEQTFPHVYANAYLTPPNGFAVKAHADDRDVLVIQVLGQKRWKVYKKVPVEFPFESEQVGKNGRKVPPSVFDGGLCFGDEDVLLSPGDVLYMPRGFVHEASTIDNTQGEETGSAENNPSFHITIAIATHDWCLSTILSENIRDALNDVTDFRKALPVGPSVEYESSCKINLKAHESISNLMDRQIRQASSVIQEKVNAFSLEKSLRLKYSLHNARAEKYRSAIIDRSRKRKFEVVNLNGTKVGPDAASKVTLNSPIRASTPSERESVVMEEGRLRGLTVREETHAILMRILGVIKKDPTRRFTVSDLRSLTDSVEGEERFMTESGLSMVCDFTLLSFARCCVEMGALVVLE